MLTRVPGRQRVVRRRRRRLKDLEGFADEDRRDRGVGEEVEARCVGAEWRIENEGLVLQEVLRGSQLGESSEKHDLILNHRQVKSQERDDVCAKRVLRDLLDLLVKVLNCDGAVLFSGFE